MQNTLTNLNKYLEDNNLKNKYPNISSLYNDSNGINNLYKLNQFEMYMLNRHSYNLTRSDSKKITIKQDLEKINDIYVNQMYKEFL